jgi:hypothetical protein
LNLGLRYELPLPWYQPQNYWATFHAGQQSTVFPNAPLGLVFYGDKGVPRGMIQTDKKNFAPRVGLAWDVFGDGRTSVRGGFGMFYDLIASRSATRILTTRHSASPIRCAARPRSF